MNLDNIEHVSTEELIKHFKEATRHGKPPQELVNEMKKRPGVAFLNPTDSAEVTMAKARAAIERVEKSEV